VSPGYIPPRLTPLRCVQKVNRASPPTNTTLHLTLHRRQLSHGNQLDLCKYRPPLNPTNTRDETHQTTLQSDTLPSQNYAVVQATLPGIENLGYKFWIVWVRSLSPYPQPHSTPFRLTQLTSNNNNRP